MLECENNYGLRGKWSKLFDIAFTQHPNKKYSCAGRWDVRGWYITERWQRGVSAGEASPAELSDEWHQLKAHEIAGRMFEHEYDLAKAVISGMEARSAKGEYTLERFKFNSG